MLNQGTGIIAAHLYDFLTRLYPTFGGGRNYLKTPAFLRRWFGREDQHAQRRAYGTAHHLVRQAASPLLSPVPGAAGVKGVVWGVIEAGKKLAKL
ncbi:MAG: hypothetical protein Q9207_000101 [Kuettlingeria erythrocarpa]